MKRTVILTLIGLMVFGGLVFAETEEVTEVLDISSDWSFEEIEEYMFPEAAWAPETIGWVYASGEWHLRVVTNVRLKMAMDFFGYGQFSGYVAYEIGAVTLRTEFRHRAEGDWIWLDGTWHKPADIPWTDWAASPVDPLPLWGFLPATGDVLVEARVYRSGHADPAAIYTSTITALVWAP